MPSSVITAAAVEPASVTERNRTPLILLGLGLGLLWFICCRHLSAEWSYNEQYNYGWFVPFFALYLFWLRWEDRPAVADAIRNPKSEIRNGQTRRAFALSIPLLFLLFPLRLIEVANPDWRLMSWAHAFIAVALTLLVIWWMGGRPWLRHFAFPVLFFLVSVPWLSGIEQPIIQGLMPTVASIATETLSLFGIPAEVQGNLIHINGGVVGVNEACSGVRSLQTSLMIGLLFGELKRLTTTNRFVLVLAAIGIAFIANCGRAFFLVWIAATRGVPQIEHWHDAAGYAIVGLVFFGCLGLTTLLARRQTSENGGQTSDVGGQPERANNPQSAIRNPQFPSSSPLPTSTLPFRNPQFAIRHFLSTFYFASALAFLLLTEATVEFWYRAHERNLRPSAQWNVRWPESAPQFHDAPIDERTKSILHHDEGRGAVWLAPEQNDSLTSAATGVPTCLLYFFRWYPGHNSALLANAHRPDVCLPASGWAQTGDFGVRSYQVAPSLTIPFRHFEFSNEANGRTRFAHAFYCVWEDRVARQEGADASSGMSSAPSDWSRMERLHAVIDGRRHLGQQVMEYLLMVPRPMSAAEAEELFAAKVPALIAPVGK